MAEGQIRYSLVTNEAGGILDDVLVGHYHNDYGQPYYVLVVNAGNRAKIVDWIRAHLPAERAERPGHEVIFSDVTRLWAMLAIQGPRSVELLQPLVDPDLKKMRYYFGSQVRILHPAAQRQGGIISRTGYTGEDGFELSIGAGIAPAIWEALMELGEPLGLVPTGIGARLALHCKNGPNQTAEISDGGSYLSQSPATAFFGIPQGTTPDRLDVNWPDGQTSNLKLGAFKGNQLLIRHSGAER